jgi:heme exporter protein B
VGPDGGGGARPRARRALGDLRVQRPLGLHRSFGVEQADRAVDALLAAPVPREAIFLGKALANLAFVAAVQLVAIPAVALFYDLPVAGGVLAGILLVAALAAVGLVTVGTLFSAMTVNTRLAELLLRCWRSRSSCRW